MVFTIGETLTGEPDKLPGIQAYVVAPVPVKVLLLPAQIDDGLALAVTIGRALTVIVVVVVFTQPLPLVPVIV